MHSENSFFFPTTDCEYIVSVCVAKTNKELKIREVVSGQQC